MRNLVSLSGPSGIGKTTLIQRIQSQGFVRITPTTSRLPRNDSDLANYHFLSKQDFENKMVAGEMAFSFFFFDTYYGYQKDDVFSVLADPQKQPVFEMYTGVIKEFKGKFPECNSIFLKPSDLSFLRKRMISRGDDLNIVDKRMEYAQAEIRLFEQLRQSFDNVLTVNPDDSPIVVENRFLEISK